MIRSGVWNADGENAAPRRTSWRRSQWLTPTSSNLSARRARRNLRAINEAKHRHPSYLGRMAAKPACERMPGLAVQDVLTGIVARSVVPAPGALATPNAPRQRLHPGPADR